VERGTVGPGPAPSAWAPLRIRLFRTLWIASLVSNVGTWMQTVGAQWLVVHDAHAAILVSLVQTAYALPAVLFALVGGVLADIFDRVRLLVAVLAGMTATGAALTVLTAAHRMPPAHRSGRPAPTSNTTTPPRHRRTLRRRPSITCPPQTEHYLAAAVPE
jgi:MFS family permease